MKRIASLILAALMALSLAACTGLKNDPVEPTVIPEATEQSANDLQPKTDPEQAGPQTATPVPEAYDPEGEAEEPIPTFDPAKLEQELGWIEQLNAAYAELEDTPFESCAVKVFSGVPGSADCPYYRYNGAEDGSEEVMNVPFSIYVDGSRIYVNDRSYNHDDKNSMFVFDMDTGAASRVACNSRVYGYRTFAVLDGKLYTSHSVEDLATGEVVEFTPCISDQQEVSGTNFMTASQGNIVVFEGYDMTEETWSHDSYTFTLDRETNTWSERKASVRFAEPFQINQVWISGIAPDGTYCCTVWLGENCAEYPVIAHLGADGSPISYTKLPYTADQMHYADGTPSLVYAADGYMYFMICSAEEVAIWRVDLP